MKYDLHILQVSSMKQVNRHPSHSAHTETAVRSLISRFNLFVKHKWQGCHISDILQRHNNLSSAFNAYRLCRNDLQLSTSPSTSAEPAESYFLILETGELVMNANGV